MKRKYDFGKYVIIKKIANGGMAEVFKAKYYGERGFAKDVAVKRVLPVWSDRKDFETMLIDEAKVLTHLQHQNIVQIFELGRDGEYLYISMEYVDGVDLKGLYRKVAEVGAANVPERFICLILIEILKGLEFAHRQKSSDGKSLNIVHRDISPQNILLSYNGEVKITDFGIAKGLHRDHETTTAGLKGKYSYMSPEQAVGAELDNRSDLYSIGIILYELLTGSRLFEAESDLEILDSVRESRLPEGWEAKVTLSMRMILKRALAKDRRDRYQSAAEFLKDLDRYVRFKKIHAHNLELSDYINDLFEGDKKSRNSEPVPKDIKTKVYNMSRRAVGRRSSVPVMRRYIIVGVLFAPLLVAAALRPEPGGDSVRLVKDEPAIQEVSAKAVSERKTSVRKAPKISSVSDGIINIDSVPGGVTGVLTYADVKKNFSTPFTLSVPDVAVVNEAKVSLKKSGYGAVNDSFVLNKNHPVFSRIYKLKKNTPAMLSIQVRPWGYVYIPGVMSKRESPVNGVRVEPGRYKIKVHYSPTNSWARANVDVKSGQTRRCFADFTNGSKISCR